MRRRSRWHLPLSSSLSPPQQTPSLTMNPRALAPGNSVARFRAVLPAVRSKGLALLKLAAAQRQRSPVLMVLQWL